MNELTILVDLSNTQVARGLYRPNPALLGDRLDQYVIQVSAAVTAVSPSDMWELRFRFYDGWFDEAGRGTDRYEMLRAHIRDNYPTRQKRRRHFAMIADAPAALPSERLSHTLRTVGGLPNVHVHIPPGTPDRCAHSDGCMVAPLRSWLRGSCPHPNGCTVPTSAFSTHRQQKLVDTALVSDAVWLASRDHAVAIASDDEDVVPGLLTAGVFGHRVVWVCRSSAPRPPYADPLGRNGIEFISCQA